MSTLRAAAALVILALFASIGGSRARAVGVVAPTLAGPVVVAAGDIACAPGDPSFNGGFGTSDACRQLHTSDVVLALDPLAVLTLGDTQYENGDLQDFLGSYDPTWGRFKEITRPARGNHDGPGYLDYFGKARGARRKAYYSFDLAGWHLVALNSNCREVGGCEAGSPQERWLRADLAAHPAVCTLAYWHHPRFSSGLHGSHPRMEALWRALHEAGADVVLAGHDHNYQRRGRTGRPIRSASASSSSAPAVRATTTRGSRSQTRRSRTRTRSASSRSRCNP